MTDVLTDETVSTECCGLCDGRGWYDGSCPDCDGKGRVPPLPEALRDPAKCMARGNMLLELRNQRDSANQEVERLRAMLAERNERLLIIYESLTGQHRSTWPPAVESGT